MIIKSLSIFICTAAIAVLSCANADNTIQRSPSPKSLRDKIPIEEDPIAVIELFTSQGCSSCPPADKLLSATIAKASKNGKKIYALSFHVDYWNRLGWTDPFSDKAYSQRQSAYVKALGLSGAYTPQMLVNGKTEFVGSNQAALSKALATALNTAPKVMILNLRAEKTVDTPYLHYELQGSFEEAVINVALISDAETTVIRRGENSGRTLTNENVVKVFKTVPAAASGNIQLPLQNVQADRVIAYVQDRKTMEIYGASSIAL